MSAKVSHFFQIYNRSSGGVIRCDQGGELARSSSFRTTMLENHSYVVEPTGADSPSQNGGAENGMIHWLSLSAPSYTVLRFLLNTGLLLSSMLHTYTIDQSTEL